MFRIFHAFSGISGCFSCFKLFQVFRLFQVFQLFQALSGVSSIFTFKGLFPAVSAVSGFSETAGTCQPSFKKGWTLKSRPETGLAFDTKGIPRKVLVFWLTARSQISQVYVAVSTKFRVHFRLPFVHLFSSPKKDQGMSVPSEKLAGAMRIITYGRVRRPGDELRPGSPSFHSEATTLADVEKEVRRQYSMPKSGPMFYKANGYWRDFAEPADLPEEDPLLVKMVVVKSKDTKTL